MILIFPCNLLEEYISISVRPYSWIWCNGNVLRAIDFCSSDGSILLQIKNKSNTENSSSSSIRTGTNINCFSIKCIHEISSPPI